MLLILVHFIAVLPQLQVAVEQKLEEGGYTGTSALQGLHICIDHRVERIWPHLNQLLAASGDLLVDEALLLLVRFYVLSDNADFVLLFGDLSFDLVEFIIAGALW